jgi:hypothetical protein
MTKDNYELVESDDLKDLKNDLDKIKKNPFITKSSGTELKSSIDGLKDSLSQMIGIFEKASDNMTMEEKEERMISRQIKPLFAKVDKIVAQNETIAEGLVTIADKTEETNKQVTSLQQQLNVMATKITQIEAQQAMVAMPPEPSPLIPQQPAQSQPSYPPPSNLPPLTGGPMPPPAMAPFPQDMSNPELPSGNAIPPLLPNQLEEKKKKSFSLFKK